MKPFAGFSFAGLSGIAIYGNYVINSIDVIGDTVLIVSTAKRVNSKGLHIVHRRLLTEIDRANLGTTGPVPAEAR